MLGFAIATIPLLFDSQIYSQYFALYKIADIPRPLDWLTPTLRTVDEGLHRARSRLAAVCAVFSRDHMGTISLVSS